MHEHDHNDNEISDIQLLSGTIANWKRIYNLKKEFCSQKIIQQTLR